MALKKAIKIFMALREFIQKKREEQVQEPEKAALPKKQQPEPFQPKSDPCQTGS